VTAIVTKQARGYVLKGALVLPALLLVFTAIPRLQSGLALEAAFPVTDSVPRNVPLSEGASYADAARALSQAPASDGATEILRAEAMRLGGADDAAYLPVLTAGLKAHPASARGWTLYAEAALAAADPERAAAALSLSLRLAPLDYRLVFQRARAGAGLWQRLDEEAQTLLFRQSALLWSEEPYRREYLNEVLLTPGGPGLMARALADQPEELRALNRFTERRRLLGF